VPEWQLRDWLPPDILEALRRLCPENITIPSGRKVRLDYREDGTVRLKAKLQELFGLANTPRVGNKNEAVIVELLAPNGHPVQTTTDLKSFWENTYPQVRKNLRGRYPKHPWPEDPWNAPATSRAKSKSR
jgi:ATP-dependent helicase HrpB